MYLFIWENIPAKTVSVAIKIPSGKNVGFMFVT